MNQYFNSISAHKVVLRIAIIFISCFWLSWSVRSEFPPLSDRGKAADANNNGLIERSEAGGPLAANFDEIDCDKNGGLDGAEIPAFFQGTGCPKPVVAASKPKNKFSLTKKSSTLKSKLILSLSKFIFNKFSS